MQNFIRNTLLSLLCLAVLAPFSFGQGNGNGNGHGKKAKHNEEFEQDDDSYREEARDNVRDHTIYQGRQVSVIFSMHDREVLRDYYRGRNSNLPPGLAKRGGNLPPGLQKHLQKNGTLPPGLQKRLTPFPEDVDRRLSPLPSIYRRGTIGEVVVIVDRRTQRIIDVINDILRP
jgi:hypothetical protein